jgi:hypothetical protein
MVGHKVPHTDVQLESAAKELAMMKLPGASIQDQNRGTGTIPLNFAIPENTPATKPL